MNCCFQLGAGQDGSVKDWQRIEGFHAEVVKLSGQVCSAVIP